MPKGPATIGIELSRREGRLEFNLVRFLLFGWYWWIVGLILYLPFRIFFRIKYQILVFNGNKAKLLTNKRMGIFVQRCFGYSDGEFYLRSLERDARIKERRAERR